MVKAKVLFFEREKTMQDLGGWDFSLDPRHWKKIMFRIVPCLGRSLLSRHLFVYPSWLGFDWLSMISRSPGTSAPCNVSRGKTKDMQLM